MADGAARMCRAIHATRLQAPKREWAVFRALQFAQFTTALVLDAPDGAGTEAAPLLLAADGSTRRVPLGDDGLWFAAA